MNLFISYLIVFFLGGVLSYFTFTSTDAIQKKPHSEKVSGASEDEVFSGLDKTDRISKLENLINEFQKNIDKLRDENDGLYESLRLSNAKLDTVLDKNIISKKLESMSEQDVKDKLARLFRKEHLDRIDDPKAFALRLTDIVVEDETKLSESDNVNSEIKVNVSRDYYFTDQENPIITASKYRRLYANIYSSKPVGEVLIKWKNLSTDELIYLKGLYIGNAENHQYAWTIPKDGWVEGRYSVALYGINQQLTPLAVNTFTINEVIDEGPEPPYDTSDGSVKEKQ